MTTFGSVEGPRIPPEVHGGKIMAMTRLEPVQDEFVLVEDGCVGEAAIRAWRLSGSGLSGRIPASVPGTETGPS